MLARNSDIEGAVNAVREMEDRFNRNFNYPWVFLNDEPFSDEFKRCVLFGLSLFSKRFDPLS
jgi:alpha 1,2-mannosyltransferase